MNNYVPTAALMRLFFYAHNKHQKGILYGNPSNFYRHHSPKWRWGSGRLDAVELMEIICPNPITT